MVEPSQQPPMKSISGENQQVGNEPIAEQPADLQQPRVAGVSQPVFDASVEDRSPQSEPRGALPLPSNQGLFGKAMEWITSWSAIGNRSAGKKEKTLRQMLTNPAAFDVSGKVLQWQCTPVQIPSGESGSRQLEGMYFESTSEERNRNPATNQAILVCSGSHDSCEKQVLPMVQALTKMGHDVLIFNYSGFGDSDGTRSEKHIYEDTVAAYDFLRQMAPAKGIPEQNTKAIGYSLGGAAAAALGTVRYVDVVLDRTFSKMSSVVEADLKDKGLPKKLRSKGVEIFNKHSSFDTQSRLSSLKGRCMIVRGDQDTTMPKEFIADVRQMIQEGALERAKFQLVHVDAWHFHDRLGQDIWNNAGEDFQQLNQKPPNEGDLWYGAARTHDRERTALDRWLRYEPPPPSDLLAA